MGTVERRVPKNIHHKMTLAEFEAFAPSFDWAAFNACMNRNNQRFNDWLAADQAWMNQQIANGGLWDYSTKPPLPASEKCV